MIVLVPSASIIKEIDLDFKILSEVLALGKIYKRKTVFWLHKSRRPYSYCFPENKKKIIYLFKDHFAPKTAIATILHEIRHFIQYKEFKYCGEDFTDFKKYYNSPEEKDAREFEKIYKEVYAVYSSLILMRNKIEEKRQSPFKELDYNGGAN
jgi:hypothetical protein